MGELTFDPDKHVYRLDGERLPSVTQILDKIVGGKFGVASWWGMKIGVEGLLRLLEGDRVVFQADLDEDLDYPVETAKIVKLLTQHKLTTNHVRDKAGDEGSLIHKAAELWGKEKIMPLYSDYPERVHGLIRSLNSFIANHKPEFIATEVIVHSEEYGYAGTFDAWVRIGDRFGLLDWKTNASGIYPEYFIQLALYEMARQEMGLTPADFRAIVWLKRDGDYAYIESPAVDFDALRAGCAWHTFVKDIESRAKAQIRRAT